MVNYYLGLIDYKSQLGRWIYIIRFACLKTLAQKYKCSIRKIFKKYGTLVDGSKTIAISVHINRGEKTYSKYWRLLTYRELINNQNQKERIRNLIQTYWKIEKREQLGGYPLKPGSFPKVTHMDFLDKISWVSWRTIASLEMPCSICLKYGQTQMHHIKHIRKRAYKKKSPYS